MKKIILIFLFLLCFYGYGVTATVNIHGLPELSTAPASDDEFPFWDLSEGTTKKVIKSNLFSGYLTGSSTLGSWTSGAGTVGSGDTYLAALQKIDGNVSGKQAALTNPVTGPASPTAAKPACWDASGDVLKDCANVTDVAFSGYALLGQQFYFGTTQIAINRGSAALSVAGVSLDDGAAQFYNVADPTKKVKIDPSNQGGGQTGTIQAPVNGTATLVAGTMSTQNLSKAAYTDINTGSDDAKYLTSLGLANSNYCRPTEIDAHTAQSPTAVQLQACNATTIHNYNQAASNINSTLPATAANLGFTATVSTAQGANYWRFTAASAGKIYLNGSATGKDYVQYTTPVAGSYFSCFTANRANAYVWYCTDGVGSLATN